MPFDRKKRAQTSGTNNNCGLNCLAHFLAIQLENQEDMAAWDADPEYQALLRAIKKYHKLPRMPTWQEIKQFLNNHPSPLDREKFFSDPLRLRLGQVLAECNKDDDWAVAYSAMVTEYMIYETVEDNAWPMYDANKKAFERYKVYYQEEWGKRQKEVETDLEKKEARKRIEYANQGKQPQDKTPLTDSEISNKIEEMRHDKLIEEIATAATRNWHKVAAKNYGTYMSKEGEMVSQEQLAELAKRFKIGLEVYTPKSIAFAAKNPATAAATSGAQMLTTYPSKETLKVINGGDHWEFELPANSKTKVSEHNKFYKPKSAPSSLTSEIIMKELARGTPPPSRAITGFVNWIPANEIGVLLNNDAKLKEKIMEYFIKIHGPDKAREITTNIIKNPALKQVLNEKRPAPPVSRSEGSGPKKSPK